MVFHMLMILTLGDRAVYRARAQLWARSYPGFCGHLAPGAKAFKYLAVRAADLSVKKERERVCPKLWNFQTQFICLFLSDVAGSHFKSLFK